MATYRQARGAAVDAALDSYPMNTKKILVIGAGPTGLGAAYRLFELGYDNWLLYEKSDYVGGHASSHVDSQGFVWDEGGHVIFSHYPYFDRLIDQMLGKEVHERVRESWIVRQTRGSPIRFRTIFDICRSPFRWIACSEWPKPRRMAKLEERQRISAIGY